MEELVLSQGDPLDSYEEETIEVPDLQVSSLPASSKHTNMVASLAAIASTTSFAEEELAFEFPPLFDAFRASIEAGEERNMREAFNLKLLNQLEGDFSNIALNDIQDSSLSPEERQVSVQTSLEAIQSIYEGTNQGLEELAVQRIKDLALTDNDQLKLMEAKEFVPGDIEMDEVLRNHVVRGLIIAKDLEDITKAQDDQLGLETALDWILGVIPLNRLTSADSIVDTLSNFFKAPGKNLRDQGRNLIYNTSQEEFLELWPKAIDNLSNQSGYISENTTMLMDNLQMISEDVPKSKQQEVDFHNVLDIMFTIPFTSVLRGSTAAVTKVLNNRQLAKTTTAQSLLKDMGEATVKEGGDDAAKAIDESLLSSLKPEPSDAIDSPSISNIVHEHIATVREAVENIKGELGALGRLEGEELEALVASEIERIKAEAGTRVVAMDVFAPAHTTEQGLNFITMGIGTTRGNLFANAAEATKAMKRMQLKGATVEEVPEGGAFLKVKYDTNESAFYKGWDEADVAVKAPLLHFLRSPDSFNPNVISEMAAQASFKKSHLFQTYKTLQKNVSGLSKKEAKRLDELTMHGEVRGKWYDHSDFADLYYRTYDELPSDRLMIANATQKEIHDLSAGVLDWSQRVLLNSKGYTGGSIKGKLMSLSDQPIKEVSTLGDLRKAVVYDMEEGVVKFGDELSEKGLKEYMDANNLKLYKTYDDFTTPDDIPAGFVLAKEGNVSKNAITPGSLVPYRAGGPRDYGAHFYIKQFQDVVVDGRRIIKNPSTLFAGSSRLELREAVENMEKARIHYKEGTLTDELVEELTPYKTTSDKSTAMDKWEGAVKRGEISKDHPFTIVRDGEAPLPSKGTTLDEAGVYDIRTEHSGTNKSGEASGRLLLSRKGKKLWGGDYNAAKVVSPRELIQTVSQNLLHTASFTDFQISAVNRWAKTYSSSLADSSLSPEQLFWRGEFGSSTPKSLVNKAEASRAAIKRVLGEGSEHSALWEHGVTRLADWVEGRGFGTLSGKILNAQSKDPFNALKGMAFDLKLGMFDMSQMIIQTQTIAAMTALRPTSAPKFVWQGGWMRMAHFNQSPEFLSYAAKKSGMPEAEFKKMVTEMNKGGYLDVNGEMILTDHHSTSMYGPTQSRIAKVRNLGRLPFYEAERLNRTYGFRMAWDDLQVKYPTSKELDKAFKNGDAQRFLSGKTNDYTVNMLNSSAAAYQKGVLAVPSQFMSYQMRMLETILPEALGGSKRFTAAQKGRLALGQMLLYGSAGLPFGAYLADSTMRATGVEFDDSLLEQTTHRFIAGGVIDSMIYAATTGEVDVAFSKRASVGAGIETFITDLFGMGMHTKSTMEMIGGAGSSVGGQVLSDAFTALKLISLAASSEQVGVAEVTPMIAQALAENMSSASRALKAYYVYKYGVYASQETGKALTLTTPAESIAALFGVPLREIGDLNSMTFAINNRQAFIKGNGKMVVKLRNEAMRALTSGDEDTYQHKLNVSSALLQGYDVKDRYDIIKWANGQSSMKTVTQKYRDLFMKKFPKGQLPQGNE